MFVSGFVDNKIAVIKRLNTEVIKIQVSCWVQRIGKFIYIILSNDIGRNAFDLNAIGKIFTEVFAMSHFKGANAIAKDVPAKHLLVDIAQQDTTSKLCKISVALDERLCVKNNRGLQCFAGDLSSYGTA